MSDYDSLVIRLKQGEYDGADIMKAWCAIQSLTAERDAFKYKLEMAEWYIGGLAGELDKYELFLQQYGSEKDG